MKPVPCTRCNRLTGKTFHREWCRDCYEQNRNSKNLSEVKSRFLSPGPFNEQIFQKVLSDFSQIKVKRQDVKMLAQLIITLNEAPIAQPRSWLEARELS